MANQPRVRRKFLDAIKPADIVDLVEDRQREHLPDTRHGPESVKRVGVMSFGGAHELEVGDEGVVALEQREVDVDALADTRVGKMVRHPVAIGRVRESALGLWEVAAGVDCTFRWTSL